jgi:hypothetical protein
MVGVQLKAGLKERCHLLAVPVKFSKPSRKMYISSLVPMLLSAANPQVH